MVAASGSMVLISGLGAVIGPILITGIMNSLGVNYFFLGLASALMMLAIFILYRISKRKPIKIDKQSTVVQTGYLPSSTVIESAQQYVKDEIIHDENE